MDLARKMRLVGVTAYRRQLRPAGRRLAIEQVEGPVEAEDAGEQLGRDPELMAKPHRQVLARNRVPAPAR